MSKTLPKHIYKSAQGTNIPKNDKKQIKNSAQATDVTYNQTEHMQNSVKWVNVKKTKHNIFKTVRKTVP